MQLRSLLSGVWSLRSDLCPLGSDYVLTSVPASELKDWAWHCGTGSQYPEEKTGGDRSHSKVSTIEAPD